MTKEIALKDNKPLFTREQFEEPKNFAELLAACEILVQSKILPKEIDTKEKCAVVIMTGRELGLRMMAATRAIYVVNGKPALSAQMMLALAYNTKEVEDVEIKEVGRGEEASCTVVVKRRGKKPYSYFFSVDMAKKLGRYANEWLKQPENMAKQRAISGNLRVTFPDAILGMYTPEEILSIEDAPARAEEERMPKAKDEGSRKETLPAKEKAADPVIEKAAEARPMPAGYRALVAVQDNKCKGCDGPIKKGDEVIFSQSKGLRHFDCA